MSLLPLLVLATACTLTTTENAPVPTTEGAASAEIAVTLAFARSNGIVTQAAVEVTVRSAPAALGPDDVLTLRDPSGHARVLEDDGRPGGGEYEAELESSDVGFVVELARGGALDRSVTIALPPPFTVSAPASASRAAGVTLAWDPSPPWTTDLEASGACLPPAGKDIALATDTGAATLQAADFAPASGDCDVTLVVTRGTPDVGQIRTLSVRTTP